MHKSKLATLLASLLPAGVMTIIALVPFHAMLTVWMAQFLGHYTALRLWKEALLVLLAVGAGYVLLKNAELRSQFVRSRLVWLIAIYLALQLVWGLASFATHRVSIQALGYGWISDVRFLIFFLTVLVVAARSNWLERVWPVVVVWPAAVIIA